jgi:cell division protein FtsI/penicillin-binding protein 2
MPGNGLAVTALQMLDVYVTLANNGVARQPFALVR